MRKWPYLMLLLGACSQGDEHPPMLGDCMTCGQAPISAGGGSGGENDATTGADAGTFDGSFDGGNNGDAANLDVLQVDVGVGNLDAPFPF